jgi:hypothetical protein
MLDHRNLGVKQVYLVPHKNKQRLLFENEKLNSCYLNLNKSCVEANHLELLEVKQILALLQCTECQ